MESSNINIAIIGIGNLGKRHLEAVLKSHVQKNVYCIDANEDARAVCEVLSSDKESVFFSTNIDDLPQNLEIVILATSAGVRRQIFEKLVEHSRVKNIVFEKVLFQKVEDYYAVKEILEKSNIKAWVNCARREWDSYHELKKEIDKCNEFEIHISGGNWGLGCNGIHMLDLIRFFDNSEEYRVTKLLLDNEIVDSKRVGYKEIFGTIIGEGKRCKSFSISCYKDSTLPIGIDIIGDKVKCSISESKQILRYSSNENGWKMEERKFDIYYQSQLTNKVVDAIYESGDCRLVKYEESMSTHLTYIEPLINYFEEKGLEKNICPIT